MRKLYIVRLTKQERVELQGVVKKLKGTSQKVRRAQILLKADADGPNWTDDRGGVLVSNQDRGKTSSPKQATDRTDL